MQINFGLATVLAAVVATAFGAAVVPVVERADELATRAAETDGHIFVCMDAGWSGSCSNIAFNAGSCVNFPFNFQDEISSIGPDSGWNCFAYRDFNCNNDLGSLFVANPGYSDLTLIIGGWNDALNSFVCNRA